MKKILTIFMFFTMSMALYAQDETNVKPFNIQFGLAFSSIQTSDNFMGSLDFGFNLFNNPVKSTSTRNFVILDIGFLTVDDNMNFYLGLSDKITFGTTSQNDLFYYYFGMIWGIGLYSNENKRLFELPIIINSGFAVGLDIYVQKNLSLFFEYIVLSNVIEFTQTMFTDGNVFFTPKFIFGKRYLF